MFYKRLGNGVYLLLHLLHLINFIYSKVDLNMNIWQSYLKYFIVTDNISLLRADAHVFCTYLFHQWYFSTAEAWSGALADTWKLIIHLRDGPQQLLRNMQIHQDCRAVIGWWRGLCGIGLAAAKKESTTSGKDGKRARARTTTRPHHACVSGDATGRGLYISGAASRFQWMVAVVTEKRLWIYSFLFFKLFSGS